MNKNETIEKLEKVSEALHCLGRYLKINKQMAFIAEDVFKAYEAIREIVSDECRKEGTNETF